MHNRMKTRAPMKHTTHWERTHVRAAAPGPVEGGAGSRAQATSTRSQQVHCKITLHPSSPSAPRGDRPALLHWAVEIQDRKHLCQGANKLWRVDCACGYGQTLARTVNTTQLVCAKYMHRYAQNTGTTVDAGTCIHTSDAPTVGRPANSRPHRPPLPSHSECL